MINHYQRYCDTLQSTTRFRQLPVKDLKQHKYIDFTTNDYLNLSKSKDILQHAFDIGKRYGVGSTGARLLSGNSNLFMEVERQIAADKKEEAVLIFNSGYQANSSVIAALCDKSVLKKQALVFCDKLNHASIYHGIALSGAQLVRYKHNNMLHLEQLLNLYITDSRPKFIITETLFGMDGDIAQLDTILNLSKQYNAFLYLDEAHATGVFGENGYGLSTNLDFKNINHLIVGTFSKGVGVCGAYIASSYIVWQYLINKCTGFIYSTAISPMILGAINAAWKKIRHMTRERKYLAKKSSFLRYELQKKGFNTGLSKTHIIPIIVGDEQKALKLQQNLYTKGIMVSAIRPPSVLPGTSRIRIALTLAHTEQDIEALINAL